ncbi:MAG: DUF748 domain-containing protein [Saprospiraceae bacterium]
MPAKRKKIILIIISSIIGLVLLTLICLSPIVKYLVEKYDEKITGRRITVAWVYANPFTGYIHMENFKMYEPGKDSIFLSAQGVSAHFSINKLFHKTYEITKISLNHPYGVIVQNEKEFNFTDLIKKLSSKEVRDTTNAPTHFNILDITIKDGEFHLRNDAIPVNYFIKQVNIESKGKRWDRDSIEATYSFIPGIGTGDIHGNLSFNFNNLNYRLATVVNNFDLNILQQYLNDISNYGVFKANWDANIHAEGNFKDKENISLAGQLAIRDFHFGKNYKEDFAAFDDLKLDIIELSPNNHKYLFDTIELSHPFFKYERYDKIDNIGTMFGRNGSKIKAAASRNAPFNLVIEIARYVKVLAKNFFRSNYQMNHLEIKEGDFKFNDFSGSEKFAVALNPFNASADSVDKNRKKVNVSFSSGIQPFGKANLSLSMNPRDSNDFALSYHFQKIPATLFNPYLISYTSFPLDRGTLELKGVWNVRKGEIKSDNRITVVDPRVTKRLKNKENGWLPLNLIMTFIRDRDNVIDYDIPITGNLNDPTFHFWGVVFGVIKNIFVKPPTTPYRIQIRDIETEIEKSLAFSWKMHSADFERKQEKFMRKTAKFLADNPDASINVTPQNYTAKEGEYALLFEAKKKYFLDTEHKKTSEFTEKDSLKVDQISVKDSLFLTYLKTKLKDSLLFTIQDKCARLVSPEIIQNKLKQLYEVRQNAFLVYFKEKKVKDQVKMLASKQVIPYNGFSFYKIEYKGELPESLLKAYREMNDLNDRSPRKKFKDERKKFVNQIYEVKPKEKANKI